MVDFFTNFDKNGKSFAKCFTFFGGICYIKIRNDYEFMNFSRQRESIINVLQCNYEHPTAYRVYELVKEVEPTISKSTVYRNLEQLVGAGLVRKISTGGNFEHYDIVRDSHSHLVCKCCGNIFDVDLNMDSILNSIKNQTEFICNEIVVMGICKDCDKEK